MSGGPALTGEPDLGTVAAAAAARARLAAAAARPVRTGRVRAVLGLGVAVEGVSAAVGETVTVSGADGSDREAEVVAADGGRLHCTPLTGTAGLRVGSRVVATGRAAEIPLGDGLLGRVVDALGRPLDGGPATDGLPRGVVAAAPPRPLQRDRIEQLLPTGVRVLDAFTPVGRGQRIGLFAGSGVGKSSLLSMLTRGSAADVTVVALVGERGREVRQFVEDDLGEEGLRRAVVLAATSDESPLLRLRAAFAATRVAEDFAARGQHVALLVDSVTRVAQAQREVALSAGEPPATRGYPPSVFALLPRLLERAGPLTGGSITGVYTVLVEGDDHNEPVADTVRAVLDGHVVLDRAVATAGRFPSVDVLGSVSRLADHVASADHQAHATRLRQLLAAHRDARDLVDVGAYVPGSNPEVDLALRLAPEIEALCRQGRRERAPLAATLATLARLATQAGGPGGGAPGAPAGRAPGARAEVPS